MHSDSTRRSHLIGIYETSGPGAHRPQGEDASEDDLRERLAEYGRIRASRDPLVTGAKKAGLSEVEIAQLTGHSRNTVRSILKRNGAD
ncbi:hypothetical protein QQM39_19380 [Streptomyces sp. DT2A-34]|uniref:hypothetical protein n=1 Tax=Streptomyces sp. DT2A-34 TaxID=3051182 RepID=UPI00265C45D5|nr:hypothetical protein [Streptomyces sp. DT2A-34]MDO0912929.1 hypothetical protein [Streptomyces sp. DT2A-34]